MHADLTPLETIFRERPAGARGKEGSHFNQLFAGYVLHLFMSHNQVRWERSIHFFSVENYVSQ